MQARLLYVFKKKELLAKENHQTNVLTLLQNRKCQLPQIRVRLQSRENYIHTQKWEISSLGRAKLSLGKWVSGCDFFLCSF
jgi:hypothetical protein